MNRNYNGLLVLFFVALLTSALFGGGPEPRIPVGSADIADDSVTNAKLAEPVSVANGGTGKTTSAEGLAALGGASLNGSSTVDFAAKKLTLNAPAVLAEGAFAFPVPNETYMVATWSGEIYDDTNNFDAPTGVFTAPVAGFYDVWAKITWDSNAVGTRIVQVKVNDDPTQSLNTGFISAATGCPTSSLGGVVYVPLGGTIKLSLFQSSGGSLDVIGQNNKSILSITYLRSR